MSGTEEIKIEPVAQSQHLVMGDTTSSEDDAEENKTEWG